MKQYNVTYFYLATGMEGNADTKDHGIINAKSEFEAIDMAILAYYSLFSDGDKGFIRGCLKATEVIL